MEWTHKHVVGLYLLTSVFTLSLSADRLPMTSNVEEAGPVLQVITLDEQPWYEAEDRAIAREIASPRNSKLRSMSIAEIKIPAGVTIVPHHHVMEEVYYIVEGEGIMRCHYRRVAIKVRKRRILP